MKEELNIVVVINSSFETWAFIFDDFEEACDFIKEDFEEEKMNSIEEGFTIDEDSTYCADGEAVLATSYNGEISFVAWSIAIETDKR